MKHLCLAALTVLLCGFAHHATADPLAARAELSDAHGKIVGSAKLTEVKEGVRVALEVSGLPPGVHAFHIHAVGKCEAPEFKSAGAHFNPYGKKHGAKNPQGMHAGDLPNLTVGPDGKGRAEVVALQVTLGPGKASLFQPEGTALVIHADPDDEITDPAGNAGARIACGIIVKK